MLRHDSGEEMLRGGIYSQRLHLSLEKPFDGGGTLQSCSTSERKVQTAPEALILMVKAKAKPEHRIATGHVRNCDSGKDTRGYRTLFFRMLRAWVLLTTTDFHNRYSAMHEFLEPSSQ